MKSLYPKKDREFFVKSIDEIIRALNPTDIKTQGEKDEDYDSTCFVYTVDTQFGKLIIKLYNESHHKHSLNLYCKFEKPPQKNPLLGARLNPFSGKWNFHYSCDVFGACEHFEMEINKITKV